MIRSPALPLRAEDGRDNLKHNPAFLHKIEMWGWGCLPAEGQGAARRVCASLGQSGDSICPLQHGLSATTSLQVSPHSQQQ